VGQMNPFQRSPASRRKAGDFPEMGRKTGDEVKRKAFLDSGLREPMGPYTGCVSAPKHGVVASADCVARRKKTSSEAI
jgi:hypothetical protein